MLSDARIVAFVPSRDLERAKAFYMETLGLTFVSQDSFALVLNGSGTMVRIAKVGEFQPANFTVLGFDVANIREEVAALRVKGISCERYPGMQQDEAGIWHSPSGARVAWFKDPDGNVLSLTEFPGGNH
ncbi:MAG TPA: VOC family protein [Terriglobales bacterium]|nr:VOC family protein [Terriglobales bacterium]